MEKNIANKLPKIKKILIAISIILVILLLAVSFIFYNILHVRHWQYVYYGKSADNNTECELLLTTPTYKSLQFYLHFRPYIKSQSFLGEIWMKANKQREYVSMHQNHTEYIIDIEGSLIELNKWKRLGHIENKESFVVKHSDGFSLLVYLPSYTLFSKEKQIVIHLKRVPIYKLPYIPSCDIVTLMKPLNN